MATSRASLPAIAAAAFLTRHEPLGLATLLALLGAFGALPGAAAFLLARAFTASVEVRERTLHVRTRGGRLEVPCTSIGRPEPWRLPLPGPGITLRLRSGARLRPGLEAEDLEPLLAALAEAGGVGAARETQGHPIVVYAHAKRRHARGLLANPAFKFLAFGLLPTAVLFNAHQHIAYGGTLGQFYLEGLGAWLATLAFYWAFVTVYLILYASIWRALGEGAALLAARAGLARAASARRIVERICAVVYYLGIPALIGARFLL